MKTINVFIYSYKNKNLFDIIQDIISKESKSNIINYYIYEQNNINNSKKYNNFDNIYYQHIRWDNLLSITYYRNIFLLKYSEYYLELSDKIILNDKWDKHLLDSIDDNNIISGKNKLKLKINNCFIEKKYEKTNTLTLNNFIDFDLLFTKFNNAIMLLQLSSLKYFGQDLYSSILFFNKNINIFSMPDDFYKIINIEHDYIPYSLYHGYNNMIEKIKQINTDNFSNFHKIKLLEINKMPYQKDDYGLNKISTNLDNIEEGRYLKSFNSIQVI